MFEITTEASFSAAHHLRDYNGPCENVHGHNWLVKVTVRCREVDSIGIGIDFKELKKALRDVLATLDHSDLNTVFTLDQGNPSSELISRWIFLQLKEQLTPFALVRVYKVEVFETPGNSAAYLED
jgi:6-pyruvoyltetrahydropterin/6-carboxytetrahydropterin synthase